MTNDIANVLLATDTLDELMASYRENTGKPLENLGQLEVIDAALIDHFAKLLRKSHEGTPFGPHKLPDGREIYISPYIRESDKRSR